MSPFDDIPGFEDDEPAPATNNANVIPLRPASGLPPGPSKDAEQALPAPFEPIDFPSLASKEPPPRKWVIDDWVPEGCVTSMSGEGGIGKSMLAQQIATCIATGVSAFGFRVGGHAPVVGVFSEDDNDELWRRQKRINDAIGLEMNGLRRLHLQGRAGIENTIALYPTNQQPQVQPLLATITAACEHYRPKLLILDNIAQLFGGNENDRHQVAHFCNLLTGLARQFGCAVLLLGHPAKVAGSQYSGSTAWSNSVRSRLFLGRDENGDLELSRPKANYAESGGLKLAWDGGVLRPTVGGDFLGAIDDAAQRQRERHIEEVFLKALDRLTELKLVVSHKPNATAFAPKMMRKLNLVGDLKPEALQDTMLRLIDRGEVLTDHKISKKADRKWSTGMVRASSVGGDPEQEKGTTTTVEPEGDTADVGASKEERPDA